MENPKNVFFIGFGEQVPVNSTGLQEILDSGAENS